MFFERLGWQRRYAPPANHVMFRGRPPDGGSIHVPRGAIFICSLDEHCCRFVISDAAMLWRGLAFAS